MDFERGWILTRVDFKRVPSIVSLLAKNFKILQGNPSFGEPTSFGCCDNTTMCNKYLNLDLPQTELTPSEIEFNG